VILYVSHTKEGVWEIIEPQEPQLLLQRRIEVGRRVRAGQSVYQLNVDIGSGKRAEGHAIALIPDPEQYALELDDDEDG
jgi:hypothetical protein